MGRWRGFVSDYAAGMGGPRKLATAARKMSAYGQARESETQTLRTETRTIAPIFNSFVRIVLH